MPTLIQTLGANEVINYGGGNTFYVDVATNPITIQILKDNHVIDVIENVTAGMQWKPGQLPLYGENSAFDALRITGTANNTRIKIFVTRSGYVIGQGDEDVIESISPSSVTVALVAIALAAQDNQRAGITFHNTHASDSVFLGNNAVTVANGMELKAGEKFTPPHGIKSAWYAIKAATSADIRVLESTIA